MIQWLTQVLTRLWTTASSWISGKTGTQPRSTSEREWHYEIRPLRPVRVSDMAASLPDARQMQRWEARNCIYEEGGPLARMYS